MAIIQTHDIFLYGGGSVDVVLRPLADEHLPLLYRWNSDPEVLYWSEDDDYPEGHSREMVERIYGSVSKNALCFLVEANGEPVGECWLQKVTRADVLAQYPAGCDVRRIDMMIGEKAWWGKGVGTTMVRMLREYAFAGENADVLHCFCRDYNERSVRLWQKLGFSLCQNDPLPAGAKGTRQLAWRQTRVEFANSRRENVPPEKIFWMPLANLQPSQLWVSAGKLRLCREWFSGDVSTIDPIPLKLFQGRHLMTDGHTRAAMAVLAGAEKIPCYRDEDELDMKAYAKDIEWCNDAGIHSAVDLAGRICSTKDYEVLWRKRCMEM